MPLKLGIDLGTTYSGVSYFENGQRVETIDLQAADNKKILPSVVYFESADASPAVGNAAVRAMMRKPELAVREIKKHMGKPDYTTPPIHGKRYRPQEISAEILKTLVKEAEVVLAEAARDVVITVPAYFSDPERAATEEAGKIAGLNVIGILSEPHAAALVYTLEMNDKIDRKYLLVYDLGGGTFDITLIGAPSKVEGGRVKMSIETVAKRGKRVGGTDWDHALFDRVADLAKREFGVDLRSDPRLEVKTLAECESAKRDLSQSNEVEIVTDQISHVVKVTRAEFEEATAHLLLQTRLLLEEVLEEAKERGIEPKECHVLLAGGSTKMPMVSRMIQEVTGEPPLTYKNPDLLVTMGAAYYAHLVDMQEPLIVKDQGGKGKEKEVEVEKFVDITTRPIGIRTLRNGSGFNSTVIPKGSPFGKEFRKEFATSEDGMQEIRIVLFEGPEVAEPESSSECEQLMVCVISGLPENHPAGSRILVTLGVDKSGILRGTAMDVATKSKVEIVFNRAASQSLEPVQA